MAVIPPWISVNPKDFVDAAAGGARIGAELAGQQNEANIAAGRNATALQEAQMRANAEQSAQQEAAQRAQAERQLQQWQVQQQIKGELERNQNTVAGEGQRNQNTVAAENQRALDALNENKAYHAGMLNHYDLMSKIAQQKADQAANPPAATAHTAETKPSEQYKITTPATPPGTGFLRTGLFHSKGVPESSITTTNASDLLGVPPGNITTNQIPGKPAMTWKIPQTPQSPFEGKRVRDKVTGKTGTISNGQFIPDSGGEANPVP